MSKTGIRLIAAITIALFLPAALAEDIQLSDPSEVDMSAERLQRINDYMERTINDEDLAGAVTLVARGGKVVHYEAHGMRYAEEDVPMTKDSIFRIASMSKPITAIALMMLFEEGHFVLDDPISKWLPEYEDMRVRETDENGEERLVPARSPVTIRHILSHTAAFDNSVSPRPDTVEEQVRIIAERPLDAHPGDGWYYRSATNQVGVLVEKISGMSLDDFLREHLFQPLGMNDTHFNVPGSKLDRVAAMYRPDTDGNVTLSSPPSVNDPDSRYFSGSGGLSSTVHDYYRLHQMMLNGGELDGVRILSPTTINLMISNHIGDDRVTLIGDGYGFGLGYAVLTDPGQSFTHLSKGTASWGGAFGTMFWINPEEDMFSIVMTQVRPYSHLRYREIFATLGMQAIERSWKDRSGYVIRANNF